MVKQNFVEAKKISDTGFGWLISDNFGRSEIFPPSLFGSHYWSPCIPLKSIRGVFLKSVRICQKSSDPRKLSLQKCHIAGICVTLRLRWAWHYFCVNDIQGKDTTLLVWKKTIKRRKMDQHSWKSINLFVKKNFLSDIQHWAFCWV